MSTSTMARVPQATYIPNKVLLGFAWADSHFNPNTLHLYNGNKPTACRTPIPVLSWVIKYLVMLDNKIERFSSSIIPFPCLPRLSLMGELLRMKSFWLVSILEYIEHRVPLSIANVIWENLSALQVKYVFAYLCVKAVWRIFQICKVMLMYLYLVAGIWCKVTTSIRH